MSKRTRRKIHFRVIIRSVAPRRMRISISASSRCRWVWPALAWRGPWPWHSDRRTMWLAGSALLVFLLRSAQLLGSNLSPDPDYPESGSVIFLSPSGQVAEQRKCFVLGVLGSKLKFPLKKNRLSFRVPLHYTHVWMTFKGIRAATERYYSFMGCNALLSGWWLSTFRRNLVVLLWRWWQHFYSKIMNSSNKPHDVTNRITEIFAGIAILKYTRDISLYSYRHILTN